MSEGPATRALAGARAAATGLTLALGDAAVRRTYVELLLALLAATALLYGVFGWLTVHLTAQEGAWWTVLRVAGLLVTFVAAPVAALFLVHVLAPLFAERVFLAGVRVRRPELADELEAMKGLSVWASAVISLRRLFRFVLLTVAVFAVSLTPLFGAVVAPILQLVLTASTLGGELLDPYLAKKGLRYQEQEGYLREHRGAIVGFALPYAFLLAVPLVGPLGFALAQAAAGILLADVLEPAAADAA